MAEQWHKQDVWTPEVEEIFNTKIKRARYHQGSYFANQVRALFSAGDLENAEILARRGLVETKELEPPRAVVLNRMIAAVRFHDSDYAGAEEAFVAAAKRTRLSSGQTPSGHCSRRRHTPKHALPDYGHGSVPITPMSGPTGPGKLTVDRFSTTDRGAVLI